MGCSYATFDPDSCRYTCSVSGDGCMYYIPNATRCAKDYGEGPEAFPHENCENCNYYRYVDGKHCCSAEWAKDLNGDDDNENSDAIPYKDMYLICNDDDDITEYCCGGFTEK